MTDVLRALLVLAATTAGVWTLSLGDDAPWYVPLVIAALLCAAAGAIADRAWTMLVPFVWALGWSAIAAIGYESGDHGDMGLTGAVILAFLFAVAAGACVAAGVALRRAAARLTAAQRSDFSPQ